MARDESSEIPPDYAERMASVGYDVIERGVDCPNCHGNGFFAIKVKGEEPERCERCRGVGLVLPETLKKKFVQPARAPKRIATPRGLASLQPQKKGDPPPWI